MPGKESLMVTGTEQTSFLPQETGGNLLVYGVCQTWILKIALSLTLSQNRREEELGLSEAVTIAFGICNKLGQTSILNLTTCKKERGLLKNVPGGMRIYDFFESYTILTLTPSLSQNGRGGWGIALAEAINKNGVRLEYWK